MLPHLSPDAIDIVVNGQPRNAPNGATVADLLSDLGLEPDRVAVELNREILGRDRWVRQRLSSGARVEIVQFVGGG